MEKKTMGGFISALRRAAGMTQRELGEQLFVSDKTVSRWERDECTPDLALIPVIADLFGVTADELLRGERNGASVAKEESEAGEQSSYQKSKGERQFVVLLKRRMVQYRNRSMISVGIALLGLIVAAIINLGFLRAQIAFWSSSCFFVAAFICQQCLYTSNYLEADDEQEMSEAQRKATQNFNRRCIELAQHVRLLTACMLAFCVPLAVLDIGTYRGLNFDYWMLYGVGFAALTLIVGHSVWELISRRQLIRRGTIVMDENEASCYSAERKLLGRSLMLLISVGVLVLAATTVVQKLEVSAFAAHHTFETQQEFVAFAEAETVDEELVYRGLFTNIYESTVSAVPSESLPDDVQIEVEEVLPPEDQSGYERRPFYGRDGALLFTYLDRRGISRIGLSDSENGFPIRVYTDAQIRGGHALQQGIVSALLSFYSAFGAVVIAVYIKKRHTLRKRHSA